MTLRDTKEAHGALLVAGVIVFCLGLVIATLPHGLWLGMGLSVIGATLAVVTAVAARRDWTRPAPPRTAAPRLREPDRFWDAQKRWASLAGVSTGFTVGSIALSLLRPDDERWWSVAIFAALLVVSTTGWFVTRRRNRARSATEE